MTSSLFSIQKKALTRFALAGFRNISISYSLRKNFYETLGVPRDASQTEIKNAYFELSKIYHPDRIAATDENLAKFREITNAYEILGNEQSRKLYDRGLLEEIKTQGTEEELKDPIVKFYKQRQDLSKAISKSEIDADAWTKTYFRNEKSKFIKKEHILKLAKETEHIKENVTDSMFMIITSFILVFFICSNLKNTFPNKCWESVFGD